jgi:hypothetical protein
MLLFAVNRMVNVSFRSNYGYLAGAACIQGAAGTHAFLGIQMNSAAQFAFGCVLLSSLVFAQAPSQVSAAEATSSIVSSEESALKPEQPSGVAVSRDSDLEIVADPASLVPDLPPVPRAKAALIGGKVERLDRVRDQVTVRVFGGGRMSILFDPRTRVYRGKEEASIADLHEGERVYLDTILDGDKVFARSIRLKTVQAVGESQGVVLKYLSDRSEVIIRDTISPAPVHVRLTSSTRFLRGDQAVAASTLSEGCLVSVRFGSEGNGHDVAREISILALPGTRYTFAGQVAHLDLRSGLLVINSSTDHKTYEVYLDPSVSPDENLHVGSAVTVVTNFDGARYVARGVTIDAQNK